MVDIGSLPSAMIEQSFDKLAEILLHMHVLSLSDFVIVNNVLPNRTSRLQQFEIASESKNYVHDAQITYLCLLRYRRTRLEYVRHHHDWDYRQWTGVLFTDASQFSLYSDDGRPLVWCRRMERDHDRSTRTVTAFNGGSVMVWAGISINTETPLLILRRTLTAKRSINEVLQPYVLPMRRQMRAKCFILMQNNVSPL